MAREAQEREAVLQADTFVELLRRDWTRLERIFKLPPWFPLVRERRDQAALSPTEQERFLCALNIRIADGSFGQLVNIHSDMTHHMHAMPAPGDPTGSIGQQRFLPWHRVYLLGFEQLLEGVHPEVTIPYWDWTKAGEESIPGWLAGYTPTVPTPTGSITVARAPGSASWLASIASNVTATLAVSGYTTFATQLEDIHNLVHVWVGGTMGGIATAPADPLFWMHHANVDRLWWQWQQSPAGTGKHPSLSGADAILDPWSYTEPMTRDITSLGYAYG
jgi:tyrosinase